MSFLTNNRFTHLFKTRNKQGKIAEKSKAIMSSRSEVNINGGGTSGYTLKEGSNKGKILGHNSTKSTNNW